MYLNITPRVVESTDWATLLFIIAFGLVATVKVTYEIRFAEFLRLGFSDKYLKIYADERSLSPFNIAMFLVQLISFSFLVQILLSFYGITTLYDFVAYIRIFTAITVFVLAKYSIEKIVAIAFEVEDLVDAINATKLSYRTYLGFIILPLTFVLFYNNLISKPIIYALIALVMLINILTYYFSIRKYQTLFFKKFFYFILYLCILEIGPYYFLYVWIYKSL